VFLSTEVLSHNPRVRSAGKGILSWEAKPTEGEPEGHELFAIQVGDTYLLVSNELGDLQRIASALASVNRSAPQDSDEMSDWQSLTRHDLWGYRRFRHSEDEDRTAAGTTEVTGSAKSLAFFVDADARNAVLRLRATDGTTAANRNASERILRLRPAGAGIWGADISLGDSEASVETVLRAMSLFGFGIYL
jgi:hypothetical protein